MLNYIYDGSFEGLLTAIYEAYYRHEEPQQLLSAQNLQHNLIDTNIHIESDLIKADKVYGSIVSKISSQALNHVYNAFLTEYPEAGTWIYQYLKLGWKIGTDIDLHLTKDEVLKIHTASRKVSSEAHRMLGLIRFSLIKVNVYYAPIKPDNNIVALLAPHFVNRLSDQNWVIHDTRREIAAVYDKHEWFVTSIPAKAAYDAVETQSDYSSLWKQYFNSIAIKDRINPKLQRQHMPYRYWEYLTEKW